MATVNDPRIAEAMQSKPTDEIGATGLVSFAGQFQESYLPELRWPMAWTKYNEMRRRDPTIASMLNAVNLLSRTASWCVEPGGNTDADKRAAEFVEQCLGDMSFTLDDAIEDLLTAIPFGWSWSEIVYKRRNGAKGDSESKYDDGLIGWRKFAPRRQSSFYMWELDETGGVQGLWQQITGDIKTSLRYVPIKTKSGCQKSLHFTAQRDMGNPEGLALFESIYESWYFVKNLQILSGVGFQRSFVGLPVFKYGTPENPYTPTDDDKRIVRETGRGLTNNEKAFVAVPGQIGFELMSVSNSNSSSMLDAIRQYRIGMLSVLLADFIALGTASTGGSYSLGQDKSELFLMAIDGWLDKIAHPDKLGLLNRYAVPYLVRVNGFDGVTDFPRIKHTSVQKPNLGALSAYLQSLSSYIHPDMVLESELRKMADLPEPDESTRFDNSPQPQPTPAGDAQNQPAPQDTNAPSPEMMDDETIPEDASMSDPQPNARGVRYWFVSEWNKLRDEFNAAMNKDA